MARILGFLAAGALTAFCQVQLSVRMEKPRYLVGEPVLVVVDIKNVGTEPVGYAHFNSRVDLTVQGTQKKQPPILGNCFYGPGSGGGFGGGVYDPPSMKPGQTVSFRYVLRDYRLNAGEYVLRASGDVGVHWSYYSFNSPRDPPPAPPKHRQGDPVGGAMFDVTLPLVIEDGTDEELRKRFVPYVTDAGAYEVDRRDRAREAISEMAPPFLEKTILGFAKDIYSARLAVEGLGRVQTPESRADLIELFDRSTDLQLRFLIVQTLAEIGTTGELAFFTSMLPGRSNQLDDQMRVYAAWGLGRVGGERAVQALSNAPPSPNPYVRSAVVVALGNTKSREAVPALLQMYRDEGVRSAVCGALLTMTHYRWCDGSGDVDSKVRRWQQWWSSHGAGLRLHGPAECPPFRAILPSVDGPAVLPVPK